MTAGQRLAEIDAVTIDAYGTLVTLDDPVGRLSRLLPDHDPADVARGFAAEAEHYAPRSIEGRDAASLRRLREECVRVFNRALGSALTVDEYMSALVFRPLEGAFEAAARLRARGLEIAVVSNADYSLVDRFPDDWIVVTSAAVGHAKPDPAIFHAALERLRVPPERALHIGDSDSDELGAAAAGIRFAPAPLAEAVAAWR